MGIIAHAQSIMTTVDILNVPDHVTPPWQATPWFSSQAWATELFIFLMFKV